MMIGNECSVAAEQPSGTRNLAAAHQSRDRAAPLVDDRLRLLDADRWFRIVRATALDEVRFFALERAFVCCESAHKAIRLFMRDVTDRQWLIRREAERVYLRNGFEKAPVAITIMRGPKHVIEYINEFGRQLIGGRMVEGRPIREALTDV